MKAHHMKMQALGIDWVAADGARHRAGRLLHHVFQKRFGLTVFAGRRVAFGSLTPESSPAVRVHDANPISDYHSLLPNAANKRAAFAPNSGRTHRWRFINSMGSKLGVDGLREA